MRHFEIHKEKLESSYTGINTNVLGQAAGDLTLNELRLYLYLASNKDGFNWTLNTTAYGNWLGSNNTRTLNKSLQGAIDGLIEKGYLFEVKDKADNYIFQEQKVPKNDIQKKEQNVPKIVKQEKEQFVPKNDSIKMEQNVPKNDINSKNEEQIVPKIVEHNGFVF